MKKEFADKLRIEYEYLWHDSMAALPDGWVTPLVKMLDRLYALSNVNRSMSYDPEGLATWVNLRIEVQDSCAFAFATPMIPAARWNGPRAVECIDALNELHGQTQETCSICGAEGHLRMRILGGDREGIFCEDHKHTRRVDRTDALYQEVRDLFPDVHGKAIDLAVPDHLWDLLPTTLRSIHKLVTAEDIVGKVLITKIEMDDGALFVRVRYQNLTAVHLGIQMAVNEMVADLEALSDEVTRKHQGGSDAAS